MSPLLSLVLVSLLTALPQPTPPAGGSFGGPLPLPLGDWVIRTPVVLVDASLTLRGSVIIARGGSLDLRGATLRLDGGRDGERAILVRAGGRLTAGPSPITLRRSRIENGPGPGRFAFHVADGASVQLVSTLVRGAGWSEAHPGLVIEARPGEETTLVDCELTRNFVGVTFRASGHALELSSLHANEHAAVALDGAAARIRWTQIADQPRGILARPGSSLHLESSFVTGHDVAVAAEDARVALDHDLFLGNGVHALFEGGSVATLDDNLLAASATAVIARGGAAARLRLNDLVANRFAVRNENEGSGLPIDARENWWGSDEGPGDAVSEGVVVSPWCARSCRRAPEE